MEKFWEAVIKEIDLFRNMKSKEHVRDRLTTDDNVKRKLLYIIGQVFNWKHGKETSRWPISLFPFNSWFLFGNWERRFQEGPFHVFISTFPKNVEMVGNGITSYVELQYYDEHTMLQMLGYAWISIQYKNY